MAGWLLFNNMTLISYPLDVRRENYAASRNTDYLGNGGLTLNRAVAQLILRAPLAPTEGFYYNANIKLLPKKTTLHL